MRGAAHVGSGCAVTELLHGPSSSADTHPYVWRVKTRLAHRYGCRCRVLVRGAMNSALVEFLDGFQVVTSRNYLRRA